jgi:threonyl-tRNA synthetase
MRLLMWHVDSFRSTITEKGRSNYVEHPEEKETYVEEAVIVYTAVAKGDEKSPDITAQRAADLIEKHAKQLKAYTVVIHPFAHLFIELAPPEEAVKIMDAINQLLLERGLYSIRTPFGWFNKLEIHAKGHPLSRVAKEIVGG